MVDRSGRPEVVFGLVESVVFSLVPRQFSFDAYTSVQHKAELLRLATQQSA